jgi:hypothetical protein
MSSSEVATVDAVSDRFDRSREDIFGWRGGFLKVFRARLDVLVDQSRWTTLVQGEGTVSVANANVDEIDREWLTCVDAFSPTALTDLPLFF